MGKRGGEDEGDGFCAHLWHSPGKAESVRRRRKERDFQSFRFPSSSSLPLSASVLRCRFWQSVNGGAIADESLS